MHKLEIFAVLVVLLGGSPALGFDFARYQAADLDALMTQRRPRSGIDLYAAQPLKLRVVLVSYAERCDVGMLKKSLVVSGVVKEQDELGVTRCIKVRSGKGTRLRLFIQDVVAEYLPKEVPLGSPLTLYAIHAFTAPDGPALLVNEFRTDASGDPKPMERAAAWTER